MFFEGKSLHEITENDLQERLVNAGLAEHFYLDYKETLYAKNDNGRKEFLLDICMFANAQGGVLLIGIPEERDEQGRHTGKPDRAAPLGIEVENPEPILQAYDASITDSIEERLSVESRPIPASNGRYVLAFRVPNSVNKPHCVRHKGHVYFPSRRQRHRYYMDVREIKELAMTTASLQERAEQAIYKTLEFEVRVRGGNDIVIGIGLMPVFSRNFLINLSSNHIRDTVRNFSVFPREESYPSIQYTYGGLKRSDDGKFSSYPPETMKLRRNGLISLRTHVPLNLSLKEAETPSFYPVQIDWLIRRFISRAKELYVIAELYAPVVLGVRLAIPGNFAALYEIARVPTYQDRRVNVGSQNHYYGPLVIDDLYGPPEKLMAPICHHIHQTFGQKRSPCFDEGGNWICGDE